MQKLPIVLQLPWMCIQNYAVNTHMTQEANNNLWKNNYHRVARKYILVANLFNLNNKHRGHDVLNNCHV